MRQAVEAGAVEEIGRHLHNRLQPVAETEPFLRQRGQPPQHGLQRQLVQIDPPEATLPEGAEVEVSPSEALASDPPFLQELLKLSKDRDWPADFALNHAHYTKGHPKKS